MICNKQRRGFLLLDALIGISIFLLFVTGIYSGIQYIFKSVYISRVRILETSVLNEQIEIVHNIAFEDVGIVNGSPSGVLSRTATTTKNGITFLITRTVRNIDDTADGVIGGGDDGKATICHNDNTIRVGSPALEAHLNHGDTAGPCSGDEDPGPPNDLSPADYKIVEFEVVCSSCGQSSPLSATTIVSPKFLEGDPTHGALKVVVIDSEGQGVVGADVHIVATSTNPTYDFIDTTNNVGELLIPDLDAGQQAYVITVTKTGYTTDMTTSSVANPVKPTASVVAQDLQEVVFEIDEVATMNVTTVNTACAPIAGVSVGVSGTYLIGNNPDVLLVNTTQNTNSGGAVSFTPYRWDDYVFSVSSYNIIGAIPMMPIRLLPGITQPVTLVLGANSAQSLLVHVQDNISLQPISNATVTITLNNNEETLTTGVGHIRQTDWSLGSGATMFSEGRYTNDNSFVDVSGSVGNITLKQFNGEYVSGGELESAIFDVGVLADFVSLIWEPFAQPVNTNLSFQIASSNTSTPESWNYVGPDGTGGTFYDQNNTSLAGVHVSKQYIRYKAFLDTNDSAVTPTLSDVAMSYTTSCTPPGQAYFSGLTADTYTVNVEADGYASTNADVQINGEASAILQMNSL